MRPLCAKLDFNGVDPPDANHAWRLPPSLWLGSFQPFSTSFALARGTGFLNFPEDRFSGCRQEAEGRLSQGYRRVGDAFSKELNPRPGRSGMDFTRGQSPDRGASGGVVTSGCGRIPSAVSVAEAR